MKPPDWASSFGQDKYGYWANLRIKEQEQCFRWIEAGEFMMGSPEDEAERYDDETLHKVRLTEGYWFADTPCTQELWQLIMDTNPSKYKGVNLPVETVSWNDANSFIRKLNNLIGEEIFNLPTEAQWEYACRAGTKTAFAFYDFYDIDNHIDIVTYSNLMNFSGNFGKTAEVKSLYRNNWGLYQMHGNVWEWCRDYYGEYDIAKGVTINPIGQKKGDSRVLRGGSEYDVVWLCRSAARFFESPTERDHDNGFRLCSV